MIKIAIYGKGGIGKSTTSCNIASALESFRLRGYARLGGLILNRRNCRDEEQSVTALAERLNTEVISDLPRSETVFQAECLNKTVIEAFPDSDMARRYRALAARLLEDSENA